MNEALTDQGKPVISFEVFPPKAKAPFEPVKEAVRRLAQLKPSYISVTYGAGGGAQANTADVASFVQECGVPAMAHLTCITANREDLLATLATLKERGIRRILCLRGDCPPGMDRATLPGEFRHAVDLVKFVKAFDADFILSGACYPECHPECPHVFQDLDYLKAKVDAGLDFLTTQMFFDNAIYWTYLSKLLGRGIRIPVRPGIMPVTNAKQISRICQLSGTVLPARFKAIVDRFGNDPAAMEAAGVAYATEQIIDLFANGVPAVHLYTMNKPEIAERIIRNLGAIL